MVKFIDLTMFVVSQAPARRFHPSTRSGLLQIGQYPWRAFGGAKRNQPHKHVCWTLRISSEISSTQSHSCFFKWVAIIANVATSTFWHPRINPSEWPNSHQSDNPYCEVSGLRTRPGKYGHVISRWIRSYLQFSKPGHHFGTLKLYHLELYTFTDLRRNSWKTHGTLAKSPRNQSCFEMKMVHTAGQHCKHFVLEMKQFPDSIVFQVSNTLWVSVWTTFHHFLSASRCPNWQLLTSYNMLEVYAIASMYGIFS